MSSTSFSHGNLNYVTAEIFESPKEIPAMQFAIGNKERSAEWLAKLTAHRDYRTVGEFGGVKIYAADNYFFTSDDGTLTYFVRYEDRAFPFAKGRYVTQIAVERDSLRAPIGVSSHVFWNLLMPIHGAIMTDNAQTERGRNFWKNQLNIALKRGAGIYMLDQSEHTARKAATASEIENAMHDAYGSTDRHKNLRLLITTRDLPASYQLVESLRKGSIFVGCAST